MIVKERSYIVMDGVSIWINNDHYTDSIYYDGKFIGTAIAKQLQFEAVNDVSYIGKEFVYYRQQEVSGVWQTAVKMGTFIVTEVEPNDTYNTVKVTAYDYMLKTHIDYSPSVSFPCTLQDVYDDLIEQVGIVAETVSLDINDDFIVESNQYEGELCVTVLQDIAEITGNYAHINADDELVLSFHSVASVETIDNNEYAVLIDKRDSTPITVVTLENSAVSGENWGEEWAEGIELYGVNEYLISDNGFAWTQAKRQELAPAILDKIKGWAYSGFEAQDCFLRGLKCGDLVTLKGMDGSTTQSIVLSIDFQPTKSVISAQSFVKASINYNKTKDPLKQVEIIVDKAQQSIQLLNQELSSVNGSLTELSNTIQQNKQSTDLTISLTGGNNLLRNSAFFKGLEYWTEGVYPTEGTAEYTINRDLVAQSETETGTEFALKKNAIWQSFSTIIGETYTFACKLKNAKSVSGKVSWIRIYRSASDYVEIYNNEKQDYIKDVSYTYVASINNPVLVIYSNNENEDFKIADIRVVKGNSSQSWSQYTDEVYGTNLRIDNTGVQIGQLGGIGETSELDNDSLIIYSNGQAVTEVSDEQVKSEKVIARTELVIGTTHFAVVGDGKVMGYRGA